MTWGPWQILLVLAIILLLFGGKKLPELAHSLGKSLGEFKKGKEEGDKDTAKKETEAAPSPAEPKQIADPKPVTPEVVS
jgi:sec-independent protein translocase protein TatA